MAQTKPSGETLKATYSTAKTGGVSPQQCTPPSLPSPQRRLGPPLRQRPGDDGDSADAEARRPDPDAGRDTKRRRDAELTPAPAANAPAPGRACVEAGGAGDAAASSATPG